MFPPSSLPLPGEILLITDELASPADFLLHRTLVSHLKTGLQSQCILLSVSEGMSRWKSIASRSNINLALSLASQSLVHIDIASDLSSDASAGANANVRLKSVFDKVRASLNQKSSQKDLQRLVILDDIATLEWIGIPVLELVRFARALCALCRKTNAALVLRHHVVTPGEPDDLLRRLLQLCTYHMDVLPLSSGKSGSVSGQVALHAGSAAINAPFRLVPRHGAVHYKLSDAGAVFFDRGTGGGVL